MGLFFDDCANTECGAPVSRSARGCSACGANAPGTSHTCGACGARVAGTANYCWRCQVELARARPPAVGGREWSRRPTEVAVLLKAADLPGWFGKKIEIGYGTRALRLAGGPNPVPLASGAHEVSASDRLLLYDDGAVVAALRFPDMQSRDGIRVTGSTLVQVRVGDPRLLMTNLMKDRARVFVGDVGNRLASLVADQVAEAVSQVDLAPHANRGPLGQAVRATLAARLPALAEKLGLRVLEVEGLDLTGRGYDEVTRRAADLASRQREASFQEQESRLRSKLREVITADRMAEVKSEEDFGRFLANLRQESDLEGLFRDRETAEVKRYFQDREIDHALSREQLIRRAEQEFDLEHRRRRMLEEEDLSRDLAEKRIQRERLEFETRQSRERIERIQRLELERVEDESDDAEARRALELLHLMKVKKLERELQQDRERQKLQLDAEIAREELASRRRSQDHAQERASWDFRIKELTIRSGMTPEQLELEVAERSPELARALGERWTAQATGNQEHMRKVEELMRGYHDEQRGDAERDKDRWANLAMEQARRQQGPVIVTGGGGSAQATYAQAQAAPSMLHCGRCAEDNPPDANFCRNCGNKLRG